MPPLVVAASVILLIRLVSAQPDGGWLGSTTLFLLVLTFISTILYYKGLVGGGTMAVLLSIIPAGLVAVVLIDRLWMRRAGGRVAALVLLCVIAVPPAFAVKNYLHLAEGVMRECWSWTSCAITPQGRWTCLLSVRRRDLCRAAARLSKDQRVSSASQPAR